MENDVAAHLVALERDGWEALTSGTGHEFYAGLLAPQAIMVFPFGVMTRQEAIDGMAQAPPWRDYELSDIAVHELGDGLAVVSYAVRAQREGDDPYEATMSSTYTRMGDEWQIVVHQQSP